MDLFDSAITHTISPSGDVHTSFCNYISMASLHHKRSITFEAKIVPCFTAVLILVKNDYSLLKTTCNGFLMGEVPVHGKMQQLGGINRTTQ